MKDCPPEYRSETSRSAVEHPATGAVNGNRGLVRLHAVTSAPTAIEIYMRHRGNMTWTRIGSVIASPE